MKEYKIFLKSSKGKVNFKGKIQSFNESLNEFKKRIIIKEVK